VWGYNSYVYATVGLLTKLSHGVLVTKVQVQSRGTEHRQSYNQGAFLRQLSVPSKGPRQSCKGTV
jgi:hypothetical protein